MNNIKYFVLKKQAVLGGQAFEVGLPNVCSFIIFLLSGLFYLVLLSFKRLILSKNPYAVIYCCVQENLASK